MTRVLSHGPLRLQAIYPNDRYQVGDTPRWSCLWRFLVRLTSNHAEELRKAISITRFGLLLFETGVG
jgi:hypothetical protein